MNEIKLRQGIGLLYGETRVPEEYARYVSLAHTLDMRFPSGSGDEGRGKDPAGSEDIRFYSASGRTELGGNHTDHNRGRVLCAAVGMDAVAAVRPGAGGRVRLVSAGYDGVVEVDLARLEPVEGETGTTAALVRGVACAMAGRHPEFALRGLSGFDAAVHSTVLRGSGLSSSASIEVLLGTIFADLGGIVLEPVEIARIGQIAENRHFGKPCGLMDQTASAVGGIAVIDFENPECPVVEKIEADFEKSGYALVVVDTGGNHADLTDDYASIPKEMKKAASVLGRQFLRGADQGSIIAQAARIRRVAGDRAFLRAMHFVAENDRVPAMARALREGNIDKYLGLVRESGDSSWKLLQNLSSPSSALEQGPCVALAVSQTLGEDSEGRKVVARVHGGGFAGTIQAYVPVSLFGQYKALLQSVFGEGSVIRLAVRGPGAIRVL